MTTVSASSSVTVQPGLLADDRWQQERCAQGKRLFDVNHRRSQVRIWCERCRVAHTLEVGIRYTDGNH